MRYLFDFLIFPGFLFTAVVGLVASWVDRKLTARVQWRKGPPFLQPFYDILKLLGKEVIVPEGSKGTGFLTAPLIGLAGVTLVSTILWGANLWGRAFVGDLIVVIYLLTLPSLAIILGGAASGNPISGLGASREMKLLLSYELPFLLAIATAIIKLGGSLRLADYAENLVVGSVSGVIAFIVTLLCAQAKLGLVPFDIPEAEQEIMGGPLIEYSGAPLAAFKLTKAMMLFALPVFLMTVFLGGFHPKGIHILWGTLKYVGILVVIVLLRNTNPRLRIDQAMRWFWGPWTVLALAGVVLALLGY